MSGPNCYFAYGSNLCPGQMEARCPGFAAVGIGVLRGHRLDFPRRSVRWGGGVAGWTAAPDDRIEGVLYQLSDFHLERLDHLEGVNEGRYRRREVDVLLGTGEIRQALCYEANREEGAPFRPTAAYLEAMIRGASHHGLSPAWIAMLRGLRADAA